MQKIIYMNQIQEYSSYIDQSVIDYIKESQVETFESFEKYDIIAFKWYDIRDVESESEKIMIYIDKDDLFYLCENESSYEKVQRYFSTADTNEKAMYIFFSNLLKGSIKHLEQLEDKISEVDDNIIDGIDNNNREKILNLRYEVFRLKKYYEQFSSIFEELCDNDNDLITEECLKYFKILNNRVIRITTMVSNLRDYTTQVRESYQAQIDIEQNQLIKFFTITTSIFLPLTLITGWYGMNLKMPEFNWKYGYLFVIVLCIFVSIIWMYIFKKKKWL